MNSPKYPDIHVQLSDEDGNVFAIMGRVDTLSWRELPPEEYDL